MSAEMTTSNVLELKKGEKLIDLDSVVMVGFPKAAPLPFDESKSRHTTFADVLDREINLSPLPTTLGPLQKRMELQKKIRTSKGPTRFSKSEIKEICSILLANPARFLLEVVSQVVEALDVEAESED